MQGPFSLLVQAFMPVTVLTPACVIFLVPRCGFSTIQSNLLICLILAGASLSDLKDYLAPVTRGRFSAALACLLTEELMFRKWLLPQPFAALWGCSHQLTPTRCFCEAATPQCEGSPLTCGGAR